MKQFFQRMISIAPRICSECDDEIDEGTLYYTSKNESIFCAACVEYINTSREE